MRQNTRTVTLKRGDGKNGPRLQLPVNPRDIFITQGQNGVSYVTVDGETVHAPGGRGLTQVRMETFLPSERSPFYTGSPPGEGLALLREWQNDGAPVRLTVSGTEIDELFLLLTLRQRLREGDEDIWIGLELKEYRVVTLSGDDPAETQTSGLYRRADERESAQTYVTLGGEDLWQIARRFLGDGSRWQELAEKNRIADPHDLPAGKEILL